MSVLLINGHPLMVEHLHELVKSVKKEMCDYIKKLMLSVDFFDLFQYINSWMDPDKPDGWFINNPRENLPGISIVSQAVSGLSLYSQRLFRRWCWTVFISPRARPRQFLAHMCHTPSVTPPAYPLVAPIWCWINDLDCLVSAMYYAITLIWGGGA